MVFMDNANDLIEALVRVVFGYDTIVTQDVKHWMNRLVKIVLGLGLGLGYGRGRVRVRVELGPDLGSGL